MNKISGLIFYFFCLSILSVGAVWHLNAGRAGSSDMTIQKQSFVRLTGLPDLAVTTAAGFIRHRSISHVNMALYVGPEVRDYFPSAFIYAPSPVTNITHPRGDNAND